MSDEREIIDYLREKGFVFNQVLARGSYGIIFLVYSIQYQSYFAVKQVPEEMFHEQEVTCLMELDDLRIVYLYQYFKINQYYYFVMEYCPSDLQRFLSTKSYLNDDLQKRLMTEILMCVKVCHDNHIAHRDIKPSNFLLDKYGRIKITDFGLSTYHIHNEESCLYVGTHLFMAPEIYKHNSKDEQPTYNPILADIWALGVTLYYIATRRYPFQSYDTNKLKELIMSGTYDDSLIPDIRLRFIISLCLQVDPNKRPSISDILQMPYFSKVPQCNSYKVCKNQTIFQPKTRQIQIVAEKNKRSSMFVYRNSIVRSRSNNDNLMEIANGRFNVDDLIH